MKRTNRKIQSITVKNFLSIKDLTVRFERSGIFRFTGLNEIGKSVLLKSMSVIMRNVTSRQYKEYLRDNETYFEITIHDFDNNYVRLSRGSVDFYEWFIDGKQGRLDKTGGKVPLEVQTFFNLYEEKEKTNACLNIRLPREKLLFVDTTPGDNAMMMQKALGTEEYLLGVKRVDKIKREINKEVTIVESYLNKEQEEIEKVNQVLSKEKQEVTNMERFEKKLRAEYEIYKTVEDMLDITLDYASKNKEIKEKKDIMQMVDITPITTDLETLKMIDNVIEIVEEQEKLKQEVKTKQNILSNVTEVAVSDKFKLLDKIDDFMKTLKEQQLIKSRMEDKENEVAQAKEALESFLEETKVCPFCGSDLDKYHTHAV